MISDKQIEAALSKFHFNSVIELKQLPETEQLFIKRNCRLIKLKKKTAVYSTNEKPNGVYFVKKGKIKIEQISYDGGTQIFFIYAEGEAFGYRPLISEDTHPVNAIVLEDCELEFIPAGDFLKLLNTSVSLANLLLVSLSREFTVLVNRINVFAQRGIKERLSLALLILNEKYRLTNSITPESEIKINRTDLANYIGTSLENLVRTLKYFKERNLITVKGKSIFIRNFEALFILSGIQ